MRNDEDARNKKQNCPGFGRQNSIFDRQISKLHLWLFWPYLFIVFHRVATLPGILFRH